MRYIRRVSVEAPATRNSHITQVLYSDGFPGVLEQATRTQVAHDIDAGQPYRSYNEMTGAEATVVARVSGNGNRYIATVANGLECDNLLHLPRF